MVKSDKLVDSELHDALEDAFKKLQTEQAESPDWHPKSNEMVQDLVHPSLYPLVYGRSLVIQDESVGVEDAVRTWAGKGETIPTIEWQDDDDRWLDTLDDDRWSDTDDDDDRWSDTYQWLPSNVAFQEDGSVKITSYINNLHPTRHPEIYSAIEKLIAAALPAWDQCLLECRGYRGRRITGPGRKESRFVMPSGRCDLEECNWNPPKPQSVEKVDEGSDEKGSDEEGSDEDPVEEDPDDESVRNEPRSKPEIKEALECAGDDPEHNADDEGDEDGSDDGSDDEDPDENSDDENSNNEGSDDENSNNEDSGNEDSDKGYSTSDYGMWDTDEWSDQEERFEKMWESKRKAVLREPEPYQEVDYEPSPTQHRLFKKFKDTGLQVIVKMASIELTPEKPEFPEGSWHVEGQCNERICATALYYLDSENITDSNLSFRMQTDSDQEELQNDMWHYSYTWLYVWSPVQ